MNRQEKEQVVESLRQQFMANDASFLVRYQGLTVSQLTSLRRKLHQQGSTFQVAKVTLLEKAIQDIDGTDSMKPMLHDQLALIFASSESTAVAKTLCDFAQSNEALKLIGGYFEKSVIDADILQKLASIPSREILLAQLCGLMKSSVVKLACLVKAIAEKKQTDAGTAEATSAATVADENTAVDSQG